MRGASFKDTRVWQVPLARQSLNSGDCFVLGTPSPLSLNFRFLFLFPFSPFRLSFPFLNFIFLISDAGLTLYHWNGGKSQGMERMKAGQFAQGLVEERNGRPHVVLVGALLFFSPSHPLHPKYNIAHHRVSNPLFSYVEDGNTSETEFWNLLGGVVRISCCWCCGWCCRWLLWMGESIGEPCCSNLPKKGPVKTKEEGDKENHGPVENRHPSVHRY